MDQNMRELENGSYYGGYPMQYGYSNYPSYYGDGMQSYGGGYGMYPYRLDDERSGERIWRPFGFWGRPFGFGGFPFGFGLGFGFPFGAFPFFFI